MRKIALMTWHHVENYGTAYQAYALKSIIQNYGYKVDLIEYRRKYEAPLKQRTLSNLVRDILHKKNSSGEEEKYKEPRRLFDDFFNNHFSYTIKCETNQDFFTLNRDYDGFVCGSDQIWGPEWFDGRYFLDFVKDTNRMIAYAPSFGVQSIEDTDIAREISEHVKRFRYLSVRESSGCRIIKNITGRNDAINVLDPVLLIKKEEWEQLCDNEVMPPTKYMLVFFLKNNNEYFQYALNLAEKIKVLPVVMHCTQSEDTIYANIENGSPEQLLSLVKNASFICTDSFHITVLSLIFNKEFLAFNKTLGLEHLDKNGRITDLLHRLDVVGHIYCGGEEIPQQIDYSKVNNKLDELRSESVQYLSAALNDLEPAKCNCSFYCENERKNCPGKVSYSMLSREGKSKIEKLILGRMRKNGFSLDESCFRCAYLNQEIKKPAFYQRLQDDLRNPNISVSTIYKNFFLTYEITRSMKKLMKGK